MAGGGGRVMRGGQFQGQQASPQQLVGQAGPTSTGAPVSAGSSYVPWGAASSSQPGISVDPLQQMSAFMTQVPRGMQKPAQVPWARPPQAIQVPQRPWQPMIGSPQSGQGWPLPNNR